MSEVRIAAEPRTEFGKGAARRIRRSHMVPAVMYGHGNEQRHIVLPGHELMLALKTANALLSVDIEGQSQLAIAKEVQRDVLRGHLEHVDLQVVNRGEKVTVGVVVLVEGMPAPGSAVAHDLNEVQVLTDATAIPGSIVLDVTGLPAGTHITAGELPLPAGTVLVTEPDTFVVAITGVPSAEQAEAELVQAEADAGIVHDEKDADAGGEPAGDSSE